MACVNLIDFKPQTEDRFSFWDHLRQVIDTTRLELKASVDRNPEWLDRYPEDRIILHQMTTTLHQCLLKTVRQYEDALKILEEMEESEEPKRKDGISEETSKHSRDMAD